MISRVVGSVLSAVFNKPSVRIIFICLVGYWVAPPQAGFPADVPRSTLDILKKLNVDASILSGLDQELQIPAEWIEKAKKEGKVRVRGTPSALGETAGFFASFRDRYPFIEVDYFGGNQADRNVKTLMALRVGKYLGDMVENVNPYFPEYERMGVVDLRDLPAIENVPEGFKSERGAWVGTETLYWCMAYNTDLVKQQDLPRRWEDILTNPVWRGGNLALGNRPNLFAAQLWLSKGEQWTKNYLARLFSEVRPQLRKEGMNALPQLAAAGEVNAIIPSTYRVPHQLAQQGAPVGFFCPEPAPANSGSSTVILKGAPNVYAAKILLNWLLSKEGQIAHYAYYFYAPVHKDLLRKEFLPFADHILGKDRVFTNPDIEGEIMPKLSEFWNRLWLTGAGGSRR
ncbi:MAG TPA: extracellular solute-binding protein [Candidatus Binatia bacterium]